MTTKAIVKAIKNLAPKAEFSFSDDDLSTLTWIKSDTTEPTIAQIEAEIAKVIASEKTEASQRLTAKAELLERLGITADEAALLLG